MASCKLAASLAAAAANWLGGLELLAPAKLEEENVGEEVGIGGGGPAGVGEGMLAGIGGGGPADVGEGMLAGIGGGGGPAKLEDEEIGEEVGIGGGGGPA